MIHRTAAAQVVQKQPTLSMNSPQSFGYFTPLDVDGPSSTVRSKRAFSNQRGVQNYTAIIDYVQIFSEGNALFRPATAQHY